MTKGYKILLAVLVILLALLSYLEASGPRELNWSPSYVASDKIPLGTYVLFSQLNDQDFPVETVSVPPFEFLNDSTAGGTYFFLNNHLQFDDQELERLFIWLEKGNDAFLIADSFSENLLDTLGLEQEVLVPVGGLSSKPVFKLSDFSRENSEWFLLDHESYNTYFSQYDSLSQRVLGVTQLYQKDTVPRTGRANFLVDSIGKGRLFLHSGPQAFSNYFLLTQENNPEYVEQALGYVRPDQPLFWDAYYKSGKVYNTSPLYVILSDPALRWAYYFVLGTGFLFILFEGKRKQRSIPVVEPPANQTYHFTRTVAGMFLDRKEYRSIALKKIALFWDMVRTKYRIPDPGESQLDLLAARSGNPLEEIVALHQYMQELQTKEPITKDDLRRLNHLINQFKRRTHGK